MIYDFEIRENLLDVREVLRYIEAMHWELVSVTRAPQGGSYVILFGRNTDG